jgi:hypothetical protein
MAAMRFGVLLCLLLAAASLSGCGGTDILSPANLEVKIQADTTVYYPFDPFSGTLTFTNKSQRRIGGEFATMGQYHVDFYNEEGVPQRSYFPDAQYLRVSYLELEPLASRTDTLEFTLSDTTDTLPPGTYRVLAWIEGHPDINSETSILLNY